MPASFSSASTTYTSFVTDSDDILTRKITLVSGQNQPAGAVLGKITSGGKYALALSASSDGSQTPDCILAEATDASGGDVDTIAYFRATVNEAALTIGAGLTADSIREGLRGKGIDLIKTIAA